MKTKITKRKYNKHIGSVVLSTRVPHFVADKVHELANETNRSASDIVCIILDSYFSSSNSFDSEE